MTRTASEAGLAPALALLQRGDHVAALAHVQRRLATRPDDVATLLLAGRICRAASDVAAAAGHFQHAVKQAPGAAEPAYLFAAALFDLDHPSTAVVLGYLLELHPRHGAGWYLLGRQRLKQGGPDRALAAFDEAIAIDPAMDQAHFQRANTLQALGRDDAALAAFREASRLAPGVMEIHFNLGLLLHRTAALAEAATTLHLCTRLAPDYADGWYNLGLVQQDLRLPLDAVASFRSALACRPDYAEAAVNLGIVLQETGNMDEAKQAYRQALRLQPSAFGRIAQAITAGSTGELWLDLAALRAHLSS
jgi:tetratricopeptide (TPR) repeat protein